MNRRITLVAGGVAVAGAAALLRPAVAPPPPVTVGSSTIRATPDAAEPDANAAAGPGTPGPTVYVVGAVRHPGVFTLKTGARIDAAVRAAGGLGSEADPVAIDLAAFARDGERILVPRLGASPDPLVERPDGTVDASASGGTADGGASETGGAGTGAADAAGGEQPKRRRAHHRKRRRHHPRANVAPADEPDGSAFAAPTTATIDINTADASALATLPGIGDGLAERIVRFREVSGPFVRPEELLDVNGMTQRTYDAIAASIAI